MSRKEEVIKEIAKLQSELTIIRSGMVKGNYYILGKKFLFQFTGKLGDGSIKGFNNNGAWSDAMGCWGEQDYKLATNTVIFERFAAEAIKRGYKKNQIKIKLIEGNIGDTSLLNITADYDLRWDGYGKRLVLETGSNLYTIYKDGEWAEIIEKVNPIINGKELTDAEVEYVMNFKK